MFWFIYVLAVRYLSLSIAYCRNVEQNENNLVIDLNSNWTLLNSNLNLTIRNVSLPTSIQTVLRQNQRVGDYLYRYNDVKYRWIGNENDWVLENTFSLRDQPLIQPNYSSLSLVFDSIDTVSSVYLNGKFVLFARNQFVKYQIRSIDSKLNFHDSNVLRIEFKSPIKHASNLASIYPYREPQECPPDVQHGECHVNFLRKEQCSFSWDWGPALIPIGINGGVELNVINSFDFEFFLSVYPTQTGQLDTWTLHIDLNINDYVLSANVAYLLIRIDDLGFKFSQNLPLNQTSFSLKPTLSKKDFNNLNLWWPSGYGSQPLYKLLIELKVENTKVQKEKRIAFRSVELVQETIGTDLVGLTFFFRINNVDIFLKGSNWIPADSFQELISPEYLEYLMKSVQIANMNVLRVWGGGVYESEHFYDLADRFGIMIWQDFMFACSVYPTNADYLSNVLEEVVYQVNRLRHRPSIIIWAANNENEAAVSTNWYNTNVDKETYANDYRKLYIDTVMNSLLQHDPSQSRPFLSSSPTNGAESIQENWLAKNPYDARFGDLHFYDYSVNGWLPSSFPIPRFMSEFGVQSLPSFATLSNAYDMNEDADMFGALNEHRQHHGNGNREIIEEIKMNLLVPNSTDPQKQFRSIIYLSQVNQAMTYKTATELFRRNRNRIDKTTGIGNCMGSMYWQLNDLWQAPTWSTIEYARNENIKAAGKWKMAHYFIKNAYAPVLLSPAFTLDSLEIHAISDLNSTLQSSFSLNIFSYESLEAKWSAKYTFRIEPFMSKPILTLSLADIQAKTGCVVNSSHSCLLELSSSDPQVQEQNSNFLFFTNRLAQVENLNTPRLQITSIEQVSQNSFHVTVQTNQIALFVWLELDTNQFSGIFSDNGFQMTTPERTLQFTSDQAELTLDVLKRHLTVQSLLNIYD
jgi:beta-mannosidase